MAIPMNDRSTEGSGFVHFGGVVRSGANAGRGIELGISNSTAAADLPKLSAVGDDANIHVAVIGKGTGGVYLGSTAAGAGTFKGGFSTTFAWTHAAISSGQFGEITIASTTADVAAGDIISISAASTMVGPYGFSGFRQAAADASRVTVLLSVPGSTATSTLSGTLRITWIDLT